MTQASRPQADNTSNGYNDSGPYSRDQWAQKLIIEHVGDEVTDRGPYYGYLNALEPTNPAGVTVSVDTGAGYVNGSLLVNSASVSFTVTAPLANPRIDLVCLVENNTNAAVSDGTASNGWIFPTDPTDYDGLSSIPAYTARLVIVKGAEAGAPVAPALDQSSTLYMVPLAQYQVSVVPAISNFTDSRAFVDANTKYLFLPGLGGRDVTGGLDILPATNGAFIASFLLADATDTSISAFFGAPSDYISDMDVYGVVYSNAAGGNIYVSNAYAIGACGESISTHSGSTGLTAEAIDTNLSYYDCHAAITLSNVNDLDIIRLTFERDATNVLDTVNADVYFVGFFISYFGWR